MAQLSSVYSLLACVVHCKSLDIISWRLTLLRWKAKCAIKNYLYHSSTTARSSDQTSIECHRAHEPHHCDDASWKVHNINDTTAKIIARVVYQCILSRERLPWPGTSRTKSLGLWWTLNLAAYKLWCLKEWAVPGAPRGSSSESWPRVTWSGPSLTNWSAAQFLSALG